MSNGYVGTMRLAKECHSYRNPDGGSCDWLLVVRGCYVTAEYSEEFAGSWIADKGWFPNLRTLAKCGIIEKAGTARGGKRAYYRMPDREGVGKALRELGYL